MDAELKWHIYKTGRDWTAWHDNGYSISGYASFWEAWEYVAYWIRRNHLDLAKPWS